MIYADESLFESRVKQRAAEIKSREMEMFSGSLHGAVLVPFANCERTTSPISHALIHVHPWTVLSSVAAFLCGQGIEGLLMMPDNIQKTENNRFAKFFWTSAGNSTLRCVIFPPPPNLTHPRSHTRADRASQRAPSY